MPAFSGIGQCDVTFDKRGLELLLDMGGGARAASLVKVTPSNCEATMPQIRVVLEEPAQRLGMRMRVNARSLVCSFCESHRRGGLCMARGSIAKRKGF